MKRKIIFRKIILNSLFVLVLLITTIVCIMAMRYHYSQYDEDDKLVAAFGWIIDLLCMAPLYFVEFDMYYIARYFLIRKEHKHKALAVMNIMAAVLSLLMIGFYGGVAVDYYFELGFDLLNSMFFDVLFIYIWSYIALRIVYCIINYYAVRDMLVEN